MSAAASSIKRALRQSSGWKSDLKSTIILTLPYPAALPSHRSDLAIAVSDIFIGADLANAMTADQPAEADESLRFAAAFMRSSAAAMKLASDFATGDYERIVRPAMAPPRVRAGFSGLQTRDHAYLVRLFGTLKPVFLTVGRTGEAHNEFIDSVLSAYAAHEFICARFRGDVLPSLRMEAASRGKTQRSGTAVIREMMRARLALVDPARPSAPIDAPRPTAASGVTRPSARDDIDRPSPADCGSPL